MGRNGLRIPFLFCIFVRYPSPMRTNRFLWLLLLLPCLGLTSFTSPAKPHTTGPGGDYCKIGGLIYLEPVQGFADYKVFVEDVEAFSDMLIYRETSPGFADAPGIWYITDVRGAADYTIHLMDVKAFADFSIFYTDFRSLAGCRK